MPIDGPNSGRLADAEPLPLSHPAARDLLDHLAVELAREFIKLTEEAAEVHEEADGESVEEE